MAFARLLDSKSHLIPGKPGSAPQISNHKANKSALKNIQSWIKLPIMWFYEIFFYTLVFIILVQYDFSYRPHLP